MAEMTIKEIDVFCPVTDTFTEKWVLAAMEYTVRAIFEVEGHDQDFGCVWSFNNEDSARDFADDTEILLMAGRAIFEEHNAQS